MCGRFELNISKDQLIQTFDIDNSQLPEFEPHFNIPPATTIPIIRQAAAKRILAGAHWGLIPSWSKDRKIAYHTFNARSESVAEKPSFRHAYKNSRCLIPATGYYEWQTQHDNSEDSGKQPFWIGRKDRTAFAMAGLYEDWTDTTSGELIESCTIITREAYPNISHIHSRMPVILPSEYYRLWLECAIDDFPMIEMDELDYYPVSKALGSPQNDYYFKPLDK
jgi:putative SOS response-associated peptidase YedK